MPQRGMIFDVDGTLVDTNPAHVNAWYRAFGRLGYDVTIERITVEIGKGGDLLVTSVLGEDAETRHGEALRKAQKEEFLKIASQERFRVFPCVPDLFLGLRARRIRTALATSSDKKHLQAICDSAGIDLPRLADVLVTKDDAETGKPAPDLVIVAWQKLSLTPAECSMVGDTVYDAQACRAAGVAFLGLLSGGTPEKVLLGAGASGVWRDTGHIFAELDRALELASLAVATSNHP